MHAAGWQPHSAWVADWRARLRRPLRFTLVGGTCGAVQLACLTLLVWCGVGHVLANLSALIFATQLNFICSARLIWPDRLTSTRAPHLLRALPQRLLAFNVMCAGTLALNEAVFAASERVVPYLVAGALGIGVAAPLNYLFSHYGVFGQRCLRARRDVATQPAVPNRPQPNVVNGAS